MLGAECQGCSIVRICIHGSLVIGRSSSHTKMTRRPPARRARGCALSPSAVIQSSSEIILTFPEPILLSTDTLAYVLRTKMLRSVQIPSAILLLLGVALLLTRTSIFGSATWTPDLPSFLYLKSNIDRLRADAADVESTSLCLVSSCCLFNLRSSPLIRLLCCRRRAQTKSWPIRPMWAVPTALSNACVSQGHIRN
jgi:hypothetical protein